MAGPWTVEISAEVTRWYASLTDGGKTQADAALERLRALGPALRMPYSKPLGGGLLELRFSCERVNRRITYCVTGRNIVTLTTFRKQRDNERREVERARKAMTRNREGR